MSSQHIQNQNYLIGEFAPMWLILSLMFFGVLSSVMTVQLLLTSDSPDSQTELTPRSRIESQVECPPLFTVTFKRNSIKPIEQDLNEKATQLRKWLNRYPQTILFIEERSDLSIPTELNLSIIQRYVVYELLAKSGIAKSQMDMRAFDEFAPLVAIPTEPGNNRRVFLRVEGLHGCPVSQEYGEIR